MDVSMVMNVIQAVLGVMIIALVLIQQQDAGFYSSSSNINRTRRGIEKFTYNSTVVIAILFVSISIANFVF